MLHKEKGNYNYKFGVKYINRYVGWLQSYYKINKLSISTRITT